MDIFIIFRKYINRIIRKNNIEQKVINKPRLINSKIEENVKDEIGYPLGDYISPKKINKDNNRETVTQNKTAEIIPVDADKREKDAKDKDTKRKIDHLIKKEKEKNFTDTGFYETSKQRKKRVRSEIINNFKETGISETDKERIKRNTYEKNDLNTIKVLTIPIRKQLIHILIDEDEKRDSIHKQKVELEQFIKKTIPKYKDFFIKNFQASANNQNRRIFYEKRFWEIYWNEQIEIFKDVLKVNPSYILGLKSSFDIKSNLINLYDESSYEGIKPCLGFCKSRDGKYKYLFSTNYGHDPEKFYSYECEVSNYGWHLASIKDSEA